VEDMMMKSIHNSKTEQFFTPKRMTAAISVAMLTLSANAAATVELVSKDGWEASLSGSIPVFAVASEHDDSENAFRVQSGFNPANLNFHVVAPKTSSGLTISGHFQIDTHLNAPRGLQNDGLFESRVANIKVSGDFGTFTLGKDFGVFNSNAIGDIASQGGVGWLGGGADTGNATGGRIGTGYVYANFNPQIKFTSNDMNGLVYQIAIINPEEPQDADIETGLPRFEGQLTYSAGNFKVWTGAFLQEVSVLGAQSFDYDMQGFDVGAKVGMGGFGLTLSYSDTVGVGADGLYGGSINDADVDATQWYVEADYQVDATRFGFSYGEGSQDSREADLIKGLGVAAEVDNELTMLFVHHQLSPQFRLIGELQNYESDVQDNYKAIVLGFQFDF
jgi:hypothetical protein